MGACARNMQSDSAEIKPAQCCIKLVFYLTYTMMHGSTKLKKKNSKRHLVSNLDSGHHQAMIQECGHIQKLQTTNQEISPLYIVKVFKIIKVKPIAKRPNDVLKTIIILFLKTVFKTNQFREFHKVEVSAVVFLMIALVMKVLACCLLAVAYGVPRCIAI